MRHAGGALTGLAHGSALSEPATCSSWARVRSPEMVTTSLLVRAHRWGAAKDPVTRWPWRPARAPEENITRCGPLRFPSPVASGSRHAPGSGPTGRVVTMNWSSPRRYESDTTSPTGGLVPVGRGFTATMTWDRRYPPGMEPGTSGV